MIDRDNVSRQLEIPGLLAAEREGSRGRALAPTSAGTASCAPTNRESVKTTAKISNRTSGHGLLLGSRASRT